MSASKRASDRVTLSFRDDREKRIALEKIQSEQGHEDLSDTLREATAEYIARRLHLLRMSA